MKTKHTKEYAKELSNGMIPKDNKEAFIEGYMSAINQSAAPELLKALIEINSIIADVSNKEEGKVNLGQLAKISINAIKKATE